jgi:ATP-dependent Zn protease
MTQTIFELLFTWGPLLLLIAVWVYFMRRSGALSQRRYMDAAGEHMQQQLSELKRVNEKLDRIASLLENPQRDK